jgi:hypothetical protein
VGRYSLYLKKMFILMQRQHWLKLCCFNLGFNKSFQSFWKTVRTVEQNVFDLLHCTNTLWKGLKIMIFDISYSSGE